MALDIWFLLLYAWFSLVLLGFTGFHWVLLGFNLARRWKAKLTRFLARRAGLIEFSCGVDLEQACSR